LWFQTSATKLSGHGRSQEEMAILAGSADQPDGGAQSNLLWRDKICSYEPENLNMIDFVIMLTSRGNART